MLVKVWSSIWIKSIYNSPFEDSHSQPIYTCFPIIAISAKSSQFLQVQKLIEHDYIGIIKVSVFQAMGSSTVARHERRSEHYNSSRVKGSSPVRGSFFVEFILLSYNSGRSDRMIYLRKNSIECCSKWQADKFELLWLVTSDRCRWHNYNRFLWSVEKHHTSILTTYYLLHNLK